MQGMLLRSLCCRDTMHY
uniref:Uncharacterized protein n=1 Tax=Anguilla anguilla TaxID=7936 RepID=A0A0E9V9W3_ANGAN